MKNGFQRKKYFINKRAQGKFILRFAAASALGGLIAVVIFNLLALKRIDEVLYAMSLPRGGTGGILLKEMLYTTITAAFITIIALMITARALFAMINGPLMKLAAEIRRIRQGDLRVRVELRRRDEFQDFARELNLMTSELNNRMAAIKGHAIKIRAMAESGAANGETAARREQMIRDAGVLEETMRAFKL